MQSIKEQSLIEAAERVLGEKKTPLNLYDLFNIVCAEKSYGENEKSTLITQFYTDLITSAKFVYTGDNMWDLKDSQKTDLSEKDGSFYKEYTKIPDVIEKEVAKAAAKPKAKAKKAKKAKKVEKVEVVIEEVAVPVEEVVVEEPKKEDKKKAKASKKAEEPKVEEYEEELFEEYEEEFDEDKYNEYMDTYEDKYDEK